MPVQTMATIPAGMIRGTALLRKFPMITYRQLDYWGRLGLFVPAHPAKGSGSHRGYSLQNLAALRVLIPLVNLGALARGDESDRASILRRAVVQIENDPDLADLPMLFVSTSGIVHRDPVEGWAIVPLPDPNERHHP